MPTWSQILSELQLRQPPDYDAIRRKYLAQLHEYSKRDVILYASGWLQKDDAQPASISIGDEDVQALMEVSYGLAKTSSNGLDCSEAAANNNTAALLIN